MRILAIGDVCGPNGVQFLKQNLRALRKEHTIDFTIVNGENTAGIGILPQDADDIFAAGADVITLGNHALDMVQIHNYLDDRSDIIRPANMPSQQPGKGVAHAYCGAKKIAVINLIGRCNMGKFHYNDPFAMADQLLKQEDSDIIIVDFHAESTSEKKAMGYHLDGRVAAVFGTHTHVPTADEQIMPKGTGYISDVGMCGAYESVLGIEKEQSVAGFRGDIIGRYRVAQTDCYLCGISYDIDDSGKCTAVQRIQVGK